MPKIVAILLCVCLLFCWFIVYAADAFDTTRITEYQKRLFNGEIATIEIVADADEWQAMMRNAGAKEWIAVDIIINGERFQSVGVRTKGNSSLMQMGGSRGGGNNSGSGRYSLQISMNRFVKGQTYYGLDTFAVNNQVYDTTRMKDYIAYDIMDFIGVDSPQTNYASVKVNGEDYGFMLMLERYDKAFLDRAYGTSAGQLYNVKIGMGMRGDFEDMWQDIPEGMPGRGQRGNDGEFPGRPQRGDGAGFPDMPQGGMDFGNRQPRQPGDGNTGFPDMPEGGMDFGGRGGMGMGGFGGGRGGGSLQYVDDNTDSYSAIFNNSIGKASDRSQQSVVKAIENLNAGTDLEKYWDVDAILRYLAAHTVVVNLDSYSSNMAQNYYIYERNGKLIVLPWDYDLSWGGFQSGNTNSTVNFPIDTPVSGVSMEDRPLINMLLEVDEYRERYHDYLRQIVEGYFESGLFENTIRELDAKINEYVKNDSTATATYEQYEASLSIFIELGNLRAESISGQLDGTIPSTSNGQCEDSSALIDASHINLSALGSMMGGGMGRGDWQGGQDGMPQMPDGFPEGMPDDWQPGNRGGPGGRGQPGGQDGFPNMPDGWPDRQESDSNTGQTLSANNDWQISFLSATDGGGQGTPPSGDNPPRGNMPEGMPNGNRMGTPPGTTAQTGIDTGYAITVGVLMIILIGAIIFVAWPRKNVI